MCLLQLREARYPAQPEEACMKRDGGLYPQRYHGRETGFGCPMALPGDGWGMGGQPTGPGLLVQAGKWDSLCGPERESARDHTQTCPMGPSDGVAGGTP